MIKSFRNEMKYRVDDDYVCHPYRDCTAHDAAAEDLAIAKSNLVVAQNNLSNAEALRDSLKNEMNEVQSMMNDFQKSFDLVKSCGPSVQRPDLLGSGALSGMIECASTYGSSVEAAHSQAMSEVSRCQAEVAKCENKVMMATRKLANTPCVWRCA